MVFFNENLIDALKIHSLFIDTLDNDWLGQGFHERLSSLQTAIEQLEQPTKRSKQFPSDKPTIIITKATSADQSIHTANEEYEEFLQSLQMLVK